MTSTAFKGEARSADITAGIIGMIGPIAGMRLKKKVITPMSIENSTFRIIIPIVASNAIIKASIS